MGTQILELGILEMEIGVTVDKLCYHNLRRDCLDSGGGGISAKYVVLKEGHRAVVHWEVNK